MKSFNNLTPMPHHKFRNKYRVPVQKLPEKYIVHTGEDACRLYTNETLPSFIKYRLTMAEAASEDKYPSDIQVQWLDLFLYKGKSGMENIAWKASETFYIVVMDYGELNKLKGLPT